MSIQLQDTVANQAQDIFKYLWRIICYVVII